MPGITRLFVTMGLLIGLASASTVTYTNQSAWLSAAPGSTALSFNGIAGPPDFFVDVSSATTVNGVNFVTDQDSLFIVAADFAPSFYSLLGGASAITSQNSNDPNALGTLTVTFPGYFYAMGFTIESLFQPTLQITLSDGETFIANAPLGGAFWGFVSTTGINSVSFYGNNPTLGELHYADPAPVIPEPNTLALLGTGIAGLSVMLRKRLSF